jgi:hypothetical protein
MNMTTLITRVVILAPFAILLVVAFAVALLVETIGDLAGTSATGKAS